MNENNYNEKWHILDDFENKMGGQGTVFKVVEKKNFNLKELYPELQKSVNGLLNQGGTGNISSGKYSEKAAVFHSIIQKFNQFDNPENHFALKVMNEIKNADLLKEAKLRAEKEIENMANTKHPNLINIVDSDIWNHWFVSPFYQKGTLENNRDYYKGNLYETLIFLRPLIDGVSLLHKKGLVHRDIKPANIFINKNNEPILGDFGLMFNFLDNPRLTRTSENVGSWEWMPPWAENKRFNDVESSFDIYSLGKLLWYLISGKDLLQREYFDNKENNVELLFPEKKEMQFANIIFNKTIVEDKKDCIGDAKQLLNLIDEIIEVIQSRADFLLFNIKRICKACGKGEYRVYTDTNEDPNKEELFGFGIRPSKGGDFKLFCCTTCGHTQLFFKKSNAELKFWDVLNPPTN